jgi:hypothetical protein
MRPLADGLLLTLDKDFWHLAVQRRESLHRSAVILFRVHRTVPDAITPVARRALTGERHWIPAATIEKLLPSASLALSINGVDCVTNKNIIRLETGWKNNLRTDSGFYPGSGFQTTGDGSSGAIRGRLEFGNRQGNLKFSVRFENGSAELTKLKNQTTGAAAIKFQYDTNNSLQIAWQKVAFAAVEVGETNGIVSVAVDCTPLYDATNGIISAVAK